jgi:hypothetical protein
MMAGPDFIDAGDSLTYTTAPANASNPAASTRPVNTGPPGKWDVVVFTDPGTSTQANYIKRLVALPGENAGNFVNVGHSVMALVLAIVGGFLSRFLHCDECESDSATRSTRSTDSP